MNQSIITVLGIETSCDETAAAIYQTGSRVLSSEIFSQLAIHEPFGGVMPEAASRSHLDKITSITQQALDSAHITLKDIDVIAVTSKPGLPGSLLIGLSFAKALAWSLKKPLIGVNHLDGHAFSSFLEHDVPFPHICLTASGGHTNIYLIHDFGRYDIIAQTLDDAAGEAFDKIAKCIDLPYPGGPIIEEYAARVGFIDYFKYPRGKQDRLDFSFSGLKTAVLYDLVNKGAYN
jgi:N6-L-threonylcarbamoyladenine synthase